MNNDNKFGQKNLMVFWKYLVLSISLMFLGCGKEIGRIKFREINTKDITFKFNGYNSIGRNEVILNMNKGKKIYFWTEIDTEFEGELDLVYNVDVIVDDTVFTTLGFTAMKDLSIEMKEIKLVLGNKTKWSYIAKMYGEFIPKETGQLHLKAVLASNPNNNALIKTADIIFKEE